MKRGSIVKGIFIAYAVFFLIQFAGSMFVGFWATNQYDVTVYSDIEAGESVVTPIGNSYQEYTAKDGFTLYEVKTTLRNTSVGEYAEYSAFSYYADGSFSDGFKGGTYTETTDIRDMDKCTLVYTNCPEYDTNFGYDIVSVIPGGCSIIRKDIVEVPEGATHIGIETIFFGDEERVITLN